MQLSTTTVGSGSRTVALVHGMSASSLHWNDVARLLAEEHDSTVTLVDLRGHGDSPRGDSYHVDIDFPDDLVETLPQGLDVLMGQSLGGRAVMVAAERLQPKRLIALDPGLKATKAFEIFVKYFDWVGGVLPDFALRRALLGKSWSCDADDAVARVKAGRKKWDPEVRKGVLATALKEPFVVKPPAVPSTIVVPEKSIVMPPDLQAELRSLGWDIRVKPGATHEIHLQDPAGLLRLLSDLL
jgi:pimeloyl-ACP methyl ester carboxylesterase